MTDICGDRDDVAIIEQLETERDQPRNRVHELKHVIQHWEVDAEGWKDDNEQLESRVEVLLATETDLTAEVARLRGRLEQMRERLKESSERESTIAATTGGYIRQLKELREATIAMRDRHEIETLATPEAMAFCAVLSKVSP